MESPGQRDTAGGYFVRFGEVEERRQRGTRLDDALRGQLRNAEDRDPRVPPPGVHGGDGRVGGAEIDTDQERRRSHFTRVCPRGYSAPTSSDARRPSSDTRAQVSRFL